MKNQQTWYAVDVRLAPAAVEAVEHALSEAGATGTEYSTLGVKEIGEVVSVVGYFDAPPNLGFIEREIKSALSIYDLPVDSVKDVSAREVENRDWLAEWKKNWRPTETARFIIAPAWQEVPVTDKTIIRIEPSMAFGTGTHETTRLCIKAIEETYDGESFFDVGTGTAILAIVVAKLAAKQKRSLSVSPDILACDTDEDSVKIAQENAALNEVENIKFYVGSIDDETPQFGFVCANLTADVIVPLLPVLVEKSEKTLLLSGILREQENWVTGELNKLGISTYKIETDGEWISILIDKKIENG